MVELWLVDLDAAAPALAVIERTTPRLAPGDLRRTGQIKEPSERRRRVAAYTALRIVLERVAGKRAGGVEFVRAGSGKPHLPGLPVEWSLTHTGSVALVAVTTACTIGVDLEAARTIRASARRREEIVAAGAGLASAPLPETSSDNAFLQSWVRLEAFAKAQGHGLAHVLQALGLRTATGRTLTHADIAGAARRLVVASDLEVRDLKLRPGLCGAVAAGRGDVSSRWRGFPVQEAAIRRLSAARRRTVVHTGR